MTYQVSVSDKKTDTAMNPEQIDQILDAILAGQYSWACVLFLRHVGYNPLDYIPARTYRRLSRTRNQSE